ncbi:hypothetical protein LCGC14_1875970, partial [marine sediment metagenome]
MKHAIAVTAIVALVLSLSGTAHAALLTSAYRAKIIELGAIHYWEFDQTVADVASNGVKDSIGTLTGTNNGVTFDRANVQNTQ